MSLSLRAIPRGEGYGRLQYNRSYGRLLKPLALTALVGSLAGCGGEEAAYNPARLTKTVGAADVSFTVSTACKDKPEPDCEEAAGDYIRYTNPIDLCIGPYSHPDLFEKTFALKAGLDSSKLTISIPLVDPEVEMPDGTKGVNLTGKVIDVDGFKMDDSDRDGVFLYTLPADSDFRGLVRTDVLSPGALALFADPGKYKGKVEEYAIEHCQEPGYEPLVYCPTQGGPEVYIARHGGVEAKLDTNGPFENIVPSQDYLKGADPHTAAPEELTVLDTIKKAPFINTALDPKYYSDITLEACLRGLEVFVDLRDCKNCDEGNPNLNNVLTFKAEEQPK